MRILICTLTMLAILTGCGSSHTFTSKTVTVVIGKGERGEDPQGLISSLDSVKIGDEVLVGKLACFKSGRAGWLLKNTVVMSQDVTNGMEAVLTLSGPEGTETFPIEFSNSMFTKTKTHKVWGQELTIQCYASVGDKWGLVIRAADDE